MPPPRDSPALSSAITLAAILCSEATGQTAATCRDAITRWTRHARATGLCEQEITDRLTARTNQAGDIVAGRQWARLLQQFGSPIMRGARP